MAEKAKPIDTRYNGYRFRSRLEARWAVFFDALGIEYEYEKEGYDLKEAGYYLPDFWLPQVDMWAEVKPKSLTEKEVERCIALSLATDSPCLELIGVPKNMPYHAFCPYPQHFAADGIRKTRPTSYVEIDFCLIIYRGYPTGDPRFYIPTSDDDSHWEDTEAAAIAARSARFEFNETKKSLV